MNYRYHQLFNQGHESHKYALWIIVAVGDTIEIPDIFSYRVTYFRTIMQFATKHANKIGATIHAHTAKSTVLYPTGSICLEFRGPQAEKRPEATLHPVTGVHYTSAPVHRGEYYGPEEQFTGSDIAFCAGWNLISIPFDKEGEPQEE